MRRFVATGVVACIFVVLLLGSPIQFSYVTSDSMEPTINEGDGYFLRTSATADVGDIVTFRSEVREEFVTHRIVDTTDEGYITQGDNNPRTDQATGHPPVTDGQIRGTVAQIRGTPIVLPHVGTLITFVRVHWLGAIVAALLVVGVTHRDSYSRDIVRADDLINPLVLGAIGVGTIVLVVGAPTVTMTFAVVEAPDSSGRVLTVNEPADRTMTFGLTQQREYTHQFIESQGVTIADLTIDDGTYDADIRVPPQAEVGQYEATIRVYRYPAVLPYGLVAALHSVHPGVAAVSVMGTIVGPIWTVFWFVCDGRTPISQRPRHAGWWSRR